MAGIGPAPKAVVQRASKQKSRDQVTAKVAADGKLRGPDLPAGDWHPMTLVWWDTLRRSPMAQTWIDADWMTLVEAALLHTEMWNGDLKVAAELRLRMGMFGTSPESRLRLRIAVDAEAGQVAEPKPKADSARRRRLLKAVADAS